MSLSAAGLQRIAPCRQRRKLALCRQRQNQRPYWTVSVTLMVCTSEPDWAVTVIVYVPAGVPAGGGGAVTPPPPQPEITVAVRRTMAISIAGAKRR
jgi:hypothetical protein